MCISEMHHPMKSFDAKCEKCHKHLYKNEIPYQAVCNKMTLDSMPNKLKDFFKKEKVLISKIILFKKMAMTHGKGKFSTITGSDCNIHIELEIIYNISPRPTVFNGLIAFKLKRDLCIPDT